MTKSLFSKNNLCGFVFLFVWIGVMIPVAGQAVVLYLEPSSGEYYQGDTFLVSARIDTENECLNTVEGNLIFSNDTLEAIDFSKGSSILSLWLKEPKIDQKQGIISFIGGIPGGYCGRLPGDPGESNLLGRIVFQVRETTRNGTRNNAKVEFIDSSKVLLNDGFGTPAKLSREGAVFTILSEPFDAAQGKNEWQEEIEKDKILPEPFEIEIHQDPSIFEGKYFITFSTADKQTGINYYEIEETSRIWIFKTTKTERAESPYLLKDQSLKSIIKVRAVDKAGNERIAEYLPLKKITWKDWLPWIILILVGAGIIWWLIKRRKTLCKVEP